MSSALETPFSLSPFTAAPTKRVGSSSWQRRAMVAAIFALEMPLFIADRPDNDRRRVAVTLDHHLKLRHALGAGAHLPRLAHHHHAHAVTGLNQLWRRHVVRGAHRVATHPLQNCDAESLQAIRHGSAYSGVV